MAKLELPVQAFVDDFVRRAYPNRDWSRGSAIRDLLVQPMSALLQPLRHEIDLLKINQSITNYLYMNRDDLDGLAANWSKFRQTGGRSQGTVRLFFDRAADYEFNYLEFFAVDGTTFILQSPVRITTTELLGNRQADNTFTFDVAVQSLGTGSRYALAAGSIVGLRNGPPAVIRVENFEDFQVTAPDESNFDVVNSMFRNLTMRNLISRSAIRAPLLETFPGILDIFIAGVSHVNMVRDLTQVEINGSDVDIHLGGMADVWVNTNGIVQREVTFSYLPSSKEIRIVSAEQADADSLLYAFSRLLLDTEGQYASPDFNDLELDESVGIFIDQAGIPVESFVIDVRRNDMWRLSARDVISGEDMISFPVPGNDSGVEELVLTDIFGRNLNNTDTQVGDILRRGDDYHRILRRDGRALRVSPRLESPASLAFDDVGGSLVVSAGDRFIPLPTALGSVEVNDRMIVSRGGAQGHYRVLAVDGTGIWAGDIRSEIQLTYVDDDGTNFTYDVASPTGGIPQIPVDVDSTHWVHLTRDGAYDQTPSLWLPIVSVLRSSGGLQIVTSGGAAVNYPDVTVVGGLRDALPDETLLTFHRHDGSDFAQSVTQAFAKGHTLYSNVLAADLPAGTDSLESVGIGVAPEVGDLILFDAPGTLSDGDITSSGGDGSKFSVFIAEILSPDEVRFIPSLPSGFTENLRYSVIRNSSSIAPGITVDAVSSALLTFNAWPLGIGDGTGLGIEAPETIATGEIDTATTQGSTTHLSLQGTLVNIDQIRPGDVITISGTASALDASHTVLEADAVAETVIIDGAPAIGAGSWGIGVTSFTVEGSRVYTIQSSTAGDTRTLSFEPPQQSRSITLSATGYVSPSLADIGAAVRQTIGGTTYAGVLESFDNTTNTWVIIPNNPANDVFGVWTGAGEELVVLNSPATGQPTAVGGLTTIGYFEPLVGDIGKIVRQGTYVGILDSFVGAPTYTWEVKPLSAFDLFDQTNVTTFVDLTGTGAPSAGLAQGTLRVPASAPTVNSGSVVATLDRPANFAPATDVDFLSRFGRHGGFFDQNRFRVYNNIAVNDTPFAGVAADTHKLVVLNGSNFDLYDLASVGTNELEVSSGGPITEPVRIANAPPARQLPIVAAVSAGATSITAPGSGLGLWAAPGRILSLQVSGSAFYLTISGAGGTDIVNLADSLPITLYPDQSIQYEILEAFHLPYMVIADTALTDYRVFRSPDAGDILLQGTTGSHSNAPAVDDQFVDTSVNFTALLAYSDFTLDEQDLELYIDDGAEASVSPYLITGVIDDNTIEVDHQFTSIEGPIAYHIVRKNKSVDSEEWYYATIRSNNTLELDVPNGFDFTRFSSYRGWQLVVHPSPGLGAENLTGPWDLPPLTVDDYDTVNKILTVDETLDHQAETTIAGVWDSDSGAGTRGFQDAALNRRVRVTFRAMNRVALTQAAGSAVSTFNYYTTDFFVLPIVRIQQVVQLNPETLEPTKNLDYTLEVGDTGLRYSHDEDNKLSILDPGNDVVFQPVRVTYIADQTIESIDSYLHDPDTEVLSANQKAKRMETISIDVAITVRSTATEADLENAIASYINNLDSTERMSKDGLIKYLYEQQVVTSIDTDLLRLDGTYLTYTGTVNTFTDVAEIFGADTACYLANDIAITKVTTV